MDADKTCTATFNLLAVCVDTDLDGYGVCPDCGTANGCTYDGDDCNDSNPLEHPNQTWYQDADGDGYSNGNTIVQCLRPVNYKTASELTATSGDCNDNNPTVNPGATEINNDGINNDCNPATPVASVSGAGYNIPGTPLFRASLSMNVTAPTTGSLKYYYSRNRLSLVSTSITGISASGSTATVTGVCTSKGVSGYLFTATVTDGNPDSMGIEIRKPDGTLHYSAPSKAIASGNYTVVGQ